MKTRYVIAGIGAAACVALAGCGGGGGSTASATHSYLGTQAPGDYWDWTIGASTFSATDHTTGATYSGSSAMLPSGFYQLNIANSSDSSAVGTQAYAFEVPGVALIAKPAGANSAPVIGASLGSAPPSGASTFNYINVPNTSWGPTSASYGTAAMTSSGSTFSGTLTQFALDGTPAPGGSATYNIQNGVLVSADQTQHGVYTPAGVAIVDEGANGGAIGVAQPATNVDLSDLINHEYRGMLFKQGNQTQLVWARSNGSGGLTGGGYTDVVNNVEDHTSSDDVSVSFTSQPVPGLVRGTIASNNGSTPIVFVINRVSGKYIIYGIASDSGLAYNFLLMQQ